jgi:hypothetical protein
MSDKGPPEHMSNVVDLPRKKIDVIYNDIMGDVTGLVERLEALKASTDASTNTMEARLLAAVAILEGRTITALNDITRQTAIRMEGVETRTATVLTEIASRGNAAIEALEKQAGTRFTAAVDQAVGQTADRLRGMLSGEAMKVYSDLTRALDEAQAVAARLRRLMAWMVVFAWSGAILGGVAAAFALGYGGWLWYALGLPR